MSEVWKYDLLHHIGLRHHHRILVGLDDKLEPPETILVVPKAAADSRSTRVAQKAKILWEKGVVHILW